MGLLGRLLALCWCRCSGEWWRLSRELPAGWSVCGVVCTCFACAGWACSTCTDALAHRHHLYKLELEKGPRETNERHTEQLISRSAAAAEC